MPSELEAANSPPAVSYEIMEGAARLWARLEVNTLQLVNPSKTKSARWKYARRLFGPLWPPAFVRFDHFHSHSPRARKSHSHRAPARRAEVDDEAMCYNKYKMAAMPVLPLSSSSKPAYLPSAIT